MSNIFYDTKQAGHGQLVDATNNSLCTVLVALGNSNKRRNYTAANILHKQMRTTLNNNNNKNTHNIPTVVQYKIHRQER